MYKKPYSLMACSSFYMSIPRKPPARSCAAYVYSSAACRIGSYALLKHMPICFWSGTELYFKRLTFHSRSPWLTVHKSQFTKASFSVKAVNFLLFTAISIDEYVVVTGSDHIEKVSIISLTYDDITWELEESIFILIFISVITDIWIDRINMKYKIGL